AQKEALSNWIAMACRKSEQDTRRPADSIKLILILDAIDQNNDGGKQLDLLKPEVLGPDAVVVTSAADDTPAREAASTFETILVPPLTAALKVQIVTDTLGRFKKKLPVTLAKRLASAKQSGSPLFLSLALEELRLDARHETLKSLVDDILATHSAQELFLKNFLLDADYGRPELPTLAAAFMALLGASRAGLTELELADLLANRDDPKASDTGKPRLPQVHLSRLLTNLGPFLLNKDGRRAPMHRILGEAAMAYYGITPAREHLYRYVAKGYGKRWKLVDERQAAEALHQATQLLNTVPDHQTDAQKRLLKDLGRLWVPTRLYGPYPEVTLAALQTLGDRERSALAMRWAKEMKGFDAVTAEKQGAAISDFANWMRTIVFDRYRLPRRLLESLAVRQQSVLVNDSPALAKTFNILGMVCHVMADFESGRLNFEHALAIREQLLSPDHLDIAESLNNLALEIREKVLGPNHLDAAESLDNLAGLHGDMVAGKATALKMYVRALAIRENALGPDDPNTAATIDHLAEFLHYSDDDASARPLCERALAIREKTLGPDHPDTANSLCTLARVKRKQGDTTAARQLYERALTIREKALGPLHPYTGLLRDYLACEWG
ncbi:MAG: tetratricopeptide repeat protein, partial [Proteobacteria bacterium]|nr:tetratricopeptide repeat protein [Pseudomonadota bacterium]